MPRPNAQTEAKIYTILLNDYEYNALQQILEKAGELGVFDHLTETGEFDLLCTAVDDARIETLEK